MLLGHQKFMNLVVGANLAVVAPLTEGAILPNA